VVCADAEGCFLTVDVGDLGRNIDRDVFLSIKALLLL
jgi:hypothetical protein